MVQLKQFHLNVDLKSHRMTVTATLAQGVLRF